MRLRLIIVAVLTAVFLFADSFGGGGGGSTSGAMTQIANTVLGSASPTITFSSIPGTFNHLQIWFQGRIDAAQLTGGVNLTFNGDGAAHYDWFQAFSNANTWTVNHAEAATSGAMCGVDGSTMTAGYAGICVIDIPNYAGTTFQKTAVSPGGMRLSTVGPTTFLGVTTVLWSSTAAITSITLTSSTGNFITGTTATLYGIT